MAKRLNGWAKAILALIGLIGCVAAAASAHTMVLARVSRLEEVTAKLEEIAEANAEHFAAIQVDNARIRTDVAVIAATLNIRTQSEGMKP